MNTRRDFLKVMGVGAGAFFASGLNGMELFAKDTAAKKSDKPKQTRPNIVFIMTDDQAVDTLGISGKYKFLKTPNLDQIAKEGAICENAFVTTSLCSPSRATCLTGCYAHIHGVRDNSGIDPNPAIPTMAQILQQNGYETAFVGKWHMKDDTNAPRPGFDYWLSFRGQGQYENCKLNENGREFTADQYLTDLLSEYAVKWIQKEREKPFCLFLWHKAVHADIVLPPRDKDLYPDAELAEPANFEDDLKDKPAWIRRFMKYGAHKDKWLASEGKPIPDSRPTWKWNPKNKTILDYLRCINAVDKSTGEVMQALRDTGNYDNTMLLFTSDNGYFLGDHCLGDKRLMYEESIRIPLLIRYPKLIKPGTKIKEMILNIDFAPTFLDLAGIKIPDTMQGSSLVPLFDAGRNKIKWRKAILCEYFQEDYAPGYQTMYAVRTERYKYIHCPYVKNDIEELYDLKKDPIEMKNLIADKKYSAILKEMKEQLEELKTKYKLI